MPLNSLCVRTRAHVSVHVNGYHRLHVGFVFSKYSVFLWHLSFVGFQAEMRTNISDPAFTQCPESTWLFFELQNKDYSWFLPCKILSLNTYTIIL